jgi:excisionase family DNA binding protein
MEEWITVQELASMLKVRPTTVYQWMFRKVPIPSVKIGGTIRFRRSEIERWLIEKERERMRRDFRI